MLATERERLYLSVAVIAAVIHFSILVYFIPHFGISASLVLKVMTEDLVFALLAVTTIYVLARKAR